MPALVHHPCKSFVSLPTHSFPLNNFTLPLTHQTQQTPDPSKTLKFNSISLTGSSQFLVFRRNYSNLRNTHVCICSKNEVIEDSTATQFPHDQENKVELLDKPSPKEINYVDEPQKPEKDEVLRPFLKFFKPSGSTEQLSDVEETSDGHSDGDSLPEIEVSKKVSVEYYDPKSGDFVVGVVVSGNENKLDVNIGADLLGTMLTKEVLPLYGKELDFLLCDIGEDAKEFSANGKMGIVKSEDALSGQPVPGRPVVEPGTLLFAEVYGRTLSGRPLLSTRRFFRRVAWHRVRQIKQLNEPIEVKITEWNTGGLLARIEGLRAFLPKAELVRRINNFTDLKNCVGSRMYVQISRINEDTNELVLSEKEAWNILNLRDGTLLEGTVQKIYSYGAQVRIGENNRSGLLHISNISRARVSSARDVLAVDEKIKVLVVKSFFPDKISLSIADLESEPGLFLTNKERVFSEAEEIAKKYRQRRPVSSATRKIKPLENSALPFEDEASMYANWKWFKFETTIDQKDSN